MTRTPRTNHQAIRIEPGEPPKRPERWRPSPVEAPPVPVFLRVRRTTRGV